MERSDSWRLSGSSTPIEGSQAPVHPIEGSQAINPIEGVPQAPVVWPDWPLRVVADTWQRDSHDLFDYEARVVQKRAFLVSRHFRVVRIGTRVEVIMDGEYPPATEEIVDYLLNVRVRDGRYVVAQAERSPTANASVVPKKLWLIVKDLPHRRHVLCEGDIIKLGRFRLRVKQLARRVLGEPPPELRLEDVVSDIERISQEDSQKMQCRICLLEGGTNEDPLICPCMCRGSIKYVHVECLRHWINGKLNLTDPRVFFFRQLPCELCKSLYPCAVRFPTGDKINIVTVPLTETPFIVLENFGGGQQGLTKGMHVFSMAGKEELKLGRGHESDVRIPDVSISRYHATIRYNFADNTFTLDDHISKFGTLVSMRKNQALDCGDKFSVQVGRTVLKLTVDSSVRPQSEVVVLDDFELETTDQVMNHQDGTDSSATPNCASGSASDSTAINNGGTHCATNNISLMSNSYFRIGGLMHNPLSSSHHQQVPNNAFTFDSAFLGNSTALEGMMSDATGIPLDSSILMSGLKEPLGLVGDNGRTSSRYGTASPGSAFAPNGGLFLSNLLYAGVPVSAATNGGNNNVGGGGSQLPPTVGSSSGGAVIGDGSCLAPQANMKNNTKSANAVNGNLLDGSGNNMMHSSGLTNSLFNNAAAVAPPSTATTADTNLYVTGVGAAASLSATGTDTNGPRNLFGFGMPNAAIDSRLHSMQSLGNPVTPSIAISHPNGRASKAALYLNSLLRMSRHSSERTGMPTAGTTSVGDINSSCPGGGSSGSSGSSGFGAVGDSASAQGDTFATSPLVGGASPVNTDLNNNSPSLVGSSSRVNSPFVYIHHQTPSTSSPWLDGGNATSSSSINSSYHHQPQMPNNTISADANVNNVTRCSNSLLDMKSGLSSQQLPLSTGQPTAAVSAQHMHVSQQHPLISSHSLGGRFAGLKGESMMAVDQFDSSNMLSGVNFTILGSERTSNSVTGIRDQSRISREFV